MTSSFMRFLDHTQRRTTVGRTPLDEWSARRKDLYLHNTQHSQQTNIPAPLPGGIRTHNLIRPAAADRRLYEVRMFISVYIKSINCAILWIGGVWSPVLHIIYPYVHFNILSLGPFIHVILL
jgi:hypothetical protein